MQILQCKRVSGCLSVCFSLLSTRLSNKRKKDLYLFTCYLTVKLAKRMSAHQFEATKDLLKTAESAT